MTVLFVCVHNAGRNQMAEAFLNTLARERGLGDPAGQPMEVVRTIRDAIRHRVTGLLDTITKR